MCIIKNMMKRSWLYIAIGVIVILIWPAIFAHTSIRSSMLKDTVSEILTENLYDDFLPYFENWELLPVNLASNGEVWFNPQDDNMFPEMTQWFRPRSSMERKARPTGPYYLRVTNVFLTPVTAYSYTGYATIEWGLTRQSSNLVASQRIEELGWNESQTAPRHLRLHAPYSLLGPYLADFSKPETLRIEITVEVDGEYNIFTGGDVYAKWDSNWWIQLKNIR